ncbi:MAG: hypothetical protein EA402_04595 [Planctomycetota bacterium]|nr:MAG: hypothetical protein EA402_04595 [Planctomycetota bacterium]
MTCRTRFCTLSMIAALLLLAACSGPRTTVVSRTAALDWHDPLELRILKVHDGLRHSRDPHVSHLIEVEVVGGDSQRVAIGDRFTLPFDEWTAGREPPKSGRVLMVTPASWVRGSGRNLQPPP